MERRKAIFEPKDLAIGLSSICLVLITALAGSAQKAGKDPSFSVLRRGVGIISQNTPVAVSASTAGGAYFTSDFDGDGVPDAGTFEKASRLFTIRRSSDGSTLLASVPQFKGRPAIANADYDGDGLADPAIWHNGMWQKLLSTRGWSADLSIFGIAGDVPVPADYDGDGRADLAIFRPAENRWYIQSSGSGKVTTFDFGIAGTDLLLPADYTGDGKADLAVYRSGVWHYIDSDTGKREQMEFGFDGGRPVPSDVDRDGTVDLVVFRKVSWYVYTGDGLVSYKFGAEEDVPLSVVPVRDSMAGR